MRKRRDPGVMSSLKLYGNFAGRLRDEAQPEVRSLSDNELQDKAASCVERMQHDRNTKGRETSAVARTAGLSYSCSDSSGAIRQ